MVRLHPDGTQTPFFSRSSGSGASQLAVARSGRIFAIAGMGLVVISPAGVEEAIHPLPDYRFGSEDYEFLSVAPDGCTVLKSPCTTRSARPFV